MTLIKINAITVPENSGDELARRFAARAGAVDDQDGFEGFELLRPTDDRLQWLVVTRWRDEESFNAVGVVARFRSRPRRRRPALTPRRPGLGLVGALVVRGGRRFGRAGDGRTGRVALIGAAARPQRAGTIGRSPGPAAAPADCISAWATAPSSEMRSIKAMRT